MLFEKTKIKKAIARADKILSDRAKILKAVEKEVAELSPLIESRLAAEASAAASAANAALVGNEAGTVQVLASVGELAIELPDDGAIGLAVERIRRQALKLRGLRSLLNEQGLELSAAHQELTDSLPAYIADIRHAFTEEWSSAVATFEKVLARRLALESLIGKLELPGVPQRAAAAADLGDAMFAPHEALRKLNGAISDITGWASMAQNALPPHPSLGVAAAYDPRGVYELAHPVFGFAAGTKVVDATFRPGILEWLVRGWDAVPMRTDSAVILAVQQAKQQIERATASQRSEPDVSPLPEEALTRGKEAHAINQRAAAQSDGSKAHHVTVSAG
jgi:hypothetical protein